MNFCCYCLKRFNEKTGLNFNEIEGIKNLIRECTSIENLIDRDHYYSRLLQLSKKSDFYSMYENEIEENKEHLYNLDTIYDLSNKLEYILKQLELGRVDLRKLSSSEITKNYQKYMENLDRIKKYAPSNIEIINIYKVLVHLFLKNSKQNVILFPKIISPAIKVGEIEASSQLYTTAEISNPDIVRKPTECYFYIPNTTMKEFTDKPLTPYQAAEIILNEYQNNWDKLIYSQTINGELENIGPSLQLKKITDQYY